MFAVDARADRVECACPKQIRLPGRDAVNVPLNTKAWTLGPYFEDLTVRELPKLEAGQRFEDAEGFQFTTGNVRDERAPATPADVHVSIVASKTHPHDPAWLDKLTLFGRYDADTAFVRIEFEGEIQADWSGHGTAVVYTVPSRLYLCIPGQLAIPSWDVTVRIIAVDLAGNESAPFVTKAKVDYEEVPPNPCAHGPGLGESEHFPFVLLGVAVLLVSLGGLALVRRYRSRHAHAQPIAPD
jgi:hypothetical protein